MPKVPSKSGDRTIGVKYPLEIDQRIQCVSDALAKQSPVPVPLTFVMCQNAQRELDVYERDLGIAKPCKPSKNAA